MNLDEEYLKSFKKVHENENKEDKLESLNETPNYKNLESLNETLGGNYKNLESLNETPDLNQYEIKENLNDGWSKNLDVEVKVNGVKQKNSVSYPCS